MKTTTTIALLVAGLVAAPNAAAAFQIESSVTNNCHERITAGALAAAGWPRGAQPPTPDDQVLRLIDAVPFTVPPVARDHWGLSLLIGVRYNDIHEQAPSALGQLAHIHNDPADQPAHCIRGEHDDGSAGDAQAVADCQRFILDTLQRAVGDAVEIDMDERMNVGVYLEFRGLTQVSVSRFAFYLGRALHALQDSFTHMLRSPADARVRHVTNWIDFARSPVYDPARDGHQHMSALDDCTSTTTTSIARVARATEASRAILAAMASPAVDRVVRVAETLEGFFVLERGCTIDNNYCDAPEIDEGMSGCSSGGAASLLVMLLVLAPLLRRRLVAFVLVIGVAGSANVAAADTPSLNLQQSAHARSRSWSAYASVSGAVDHAAAAGSLAIRKRVARWLTLGLDAEYNPWLSLDSGRLSAGTVNVYGTLIYHHGRYGSMELRSTAHVGTSVMMFDSVGVDKGSRGLFIGGSILGFSRRLSRRTRLVVDPVVIAVPIPQVSGFPFFYRQYRATVGIEVDL